MEGTWLCRGPRCPRLHDCNDHIVPYGLSREGPRSEIGDLKERGVWSPMYSQVPGTQAGALRAVGGLWETLCLCPRAPGSGTHMPERSTCSCLDPPVPLPSPRSILSDTYSPSATLCCCMPGTLLPQASAPTVPFPGCASFPSFSGPVPMPPPADSRLPCTLPRADGPSGSLTLCLW